MSKYQNLLLNLFALTIILATSLWVSPALAVTQELQLNTAMGYVVKTTFSYDDAKNPEIIAEHGRGKTQIVDSMRVSFYKPSGELIASYDNIIDGMAQGTYFEFNYQPATQQLRGEIDLGGELPGEMYLKGKVDEELSLIKVQTSGDEQIFDIVK